MTENEIQFGFIIKNRKFLFLILLYIRQNRFLASFNSFYNCRAIIPLKCSTSDIDVKSTIYHLKQNLLYKHGSLEKAFSELDTVGVDFCSDFSHFSLITYENSNFLFFRHLCWWKFDVFLL